MLFMLLGLDEGLARAVAMLLLWKSKPSKRSTNANDEIEQR